MIENVACKYSVTVTIAGNHFEGGTLELRSMLSGNRVKMPTTLL